MSIKGDKLSYDNNENIKTKVNKLTEESWSHPFLEGCEHIPTDQEDAVKQLRSWLQKQPHLPLLTREHLHLFLHSNYYNVEDTQSTIETYFTIRTASPELFANKKLCLKMFNISNMATLKKRSTEGYHVLLYRLSNFEPSKFNFVETMKAFFLFNDIRLSEDGLSPGYIVIFDMKGVCLGHLARINLSAIRKFMSYIQDGHPSRLKGVHVINTVGFFDKILCIIKPLMKSGLLNLLHIHGSDLSQLHKVVPKEVFPADYGGDDEPTQQIHDNHCKMVESRYNDWIDEEEVYVSDNSKKPKSAKKQCVIATTFKSLSID